MYVPVGLVTGAPASLEEPAAEPAAVFFFLFLFLASPVAKGVDSPSLSITVSLGGVGTSTV